MTSQGWKSLLTPESSALARFRADRGIWPELAFQPQEAGPTTGPGGGAAPGEGSAAGVRTHLLWAIQYDWQPADLPLLRYLLAQQMKVAEYRGPESAEWLDDLSRAVRLVARGRDETDLLQLYAAVHLLVTNPAQTDQSWVSYYSKLASLRAGLEHEDHGKMGEGGYGKQTESPAQHRLITPGLSDAASSPSVLPETPTTARPVGPGAGLLAEPAGDRTIESQVSRAFMAGGPEPASSVVSEWAANRPVNYESLNTQTDLYASLGEYEAAADAARRLIELPDPAQPDPDLARFEALRRLARLERQSGNMDAAWRALAEAQQNLTEHPHWREFGPGQALATEYFLLTAALDPQEPLARAALKIGDKLTRKLGPLDEYLRQVALRAADHCGDERLRRRYTRPSG